MFVPDAGLTGIGTFQSDLLDLTVTVVPGSDYTNIAGYWAERNKTSDVNGKRDGGSFGNINLQTKRGVPYSGEGTFEFCIVDTGTNNPVTIANFSFAIWDLDWRKDEAIHPGVSVKEKLIVDTAQALRYSVFPNFTESEVSPICENGDIPVCTDSECTLVHPGHHSCPGQRTVFRASEFGTGPDNPYSPENITDAHRKRAVNFFFEDTSCFEITYAHYCALDDPPNAYEWPITPDQLAYSAHCNMGNYSGGNFLFSGESDALYYTEGCPTASPTTAPTGDPTVSPTKAPTGVPTVSPTKAPTVSPTIPAPTGSPTIPSPTANPTKTPTANPTEPGPTSTPTVWESSCPAGGGDTENLGVLNMCLRTSLGYSYSTPDGSVTTFQEVNFIETLIQITYDMTSGFCVDAFSVGPKERELTTIAESYDDALIAYLCIGPQNPEYNSGANNEVVNLSNGVSYEKPKPVTEYNSALGAGAKRFNQGALINVCVQVKDEFAAQDIVLKSLLEFTWSRTGGTTFDSAIGGGSGTNSINQVAITGGSPAGNFLTSYVSGNCLNQYWCDFASILFAQFYNTDGSVSGSGDATLQFKTTRRRRRLAGEEEEHHEFRRLQEDAGSAGMDISIDVIGNFDGPGTLKTAGGASLGRTAAFPFAVASFLLFSAFWA